MSSVYYSRQTDCTLGVVGRVVRRPPRVIMHHAMSRDSLVFPLGIETAGDESLLEVMGGGSMF